MKEFLSGINIRTVIGLIITMIGLLLTGCGDLTTHSNQQESKDEHTPNVEREAFKLEKASFQTGDRFIHYPQLTEMENEELQKGINDLIKNDVSQFFQSYEDVDATLDLEYQVMTKSEDMLSIVYTGYYSLKSGMYPTHLLFSTNIDLNVGERRKLTHWVTIDESFIKEFWKAPFIRLGVYEFPK